MNMQLAGGADEQAISIIIPTFNEQKHIGDLVRAIRQRESGEGYIKQIIVADGGSQDDTIRVAEQAGATALKCGKKGRASQMNEGANHATGDILYFLHADTFPPQEFARDIVRAITRGAGAGCFRLAFDDDHPLLQFYGWCTRFKSTLVRFGDQSLFVKADVFRKIGGFDDSLVVMEDQKIVSDLKEVVPFALLERAVETSARTYKKNGVVRLQFIFFMIVILYYGGAKQDTLVHLYNSLIEL